MFKEFEEYLAKYEEGLRNDYLNAAKAKKDWAMEYHNKPLDITKASFWDSKKYSSYCCYTVTENAKEEIVNLNGRKFFVIIDYRTLDGNLYEEVVGATEEREEDGQLKYLYVYGRTAKMIEALYDGWHKFLSDREVLEADVNLTYGRDEQWIVERAHKDMLAHKKWIENKIEKMLVKVDKVDKVTDGWYLTGTNGKVAHMWFVPAGGYNIQRFHYRCLVKEVKNS